MSGTDAIAERLAGLAAFLETHQTLWRHRPYLDPDVPWAERHPQVVDWLLQRTEKEVETLHAEPEQLAEGALSSLWRDAAKLVHMPSVGEGIPISAWKTFRVAGRKRRQVEATMRVAARLPGWAWVDWCSGKGHLGRGLATAAQRRPLLYVEQHRHLAVAATARARAEGTAVDAVVADVLRQPVDLPAGAAVVALHACGALTDTACERGGRAGVRSFGLVPCCYHHFPGHDVVPLRSQVARAHPVTLSPRAARFATAEEVVASPRRRARRRREQAFRLGFDLLRREVTGAASYTSLQSIPLAWVLGSFEGFVARVAEREGLVMPAFDPATAEARGWRAWLEATRLSVARVPFRRALELYLVLDRALWLAEAGYEVALGELCPRALTPRNLWLRAVRY